MNIYDVSKKAGVSIATVSRVINGNTNVSPKTRDMVLQTIEECGYTPNAFARGLGLDSMNTIGIMCADSSDPFMAKAIFYLEKALRQNHYDVLLCCTGYQHSDKEKYMNLLLSKRTDAIILVGSNYVENQDNDNAYIRKAAAHIPIMLLNGMLNGHNIYSTLCDDQYAVQDATNALIKSGSNNIIYLYNASSYSGNNKLTGFKTAIAATLNAADSSNSKVHYIDGGIAETTTYLKGLKDKNFDAVVASDDTLAIGALKYAKALGLQVPEQLAIIGYNNSIIALCSEPELTSIDNNVESLCSKCIANLMDVFNQEQVPSQTIYPAQLIKRGTTSF